MKIPKNLAAVADLYKTVRDKRLAIEKEAAKVKEDEGQLREYLINNLPKSKIGGISGKLARVEVQVKEVPMIEDRDAFFKAAKRKGNEDLLTQTLNAAAVRQRWDAGKEVPGVGKHNAVTLSLHTIKATRK